MSARRRNLLDPIPEPDGDAFSDLDELAEEIESALNIVSDDESEEREDGEDAE